MSRDLSMIPQYDTKLFTDIWEEVNDFAYDYQHVGIPTTISLANITTLYYLLYARYANNPIANYDENQFKYKVFSIIFQYGPTWEKRLSVQQSLRGLQLDDIVDDGQLHELFEHEGTGEDSESGTNTGTVGVSGQGEDIKNHAMNPSTQPATNAYTPLNYINDQLANKNTSSSTTTNNLANSRTGSNSNTATNETTRAIKAGKLKGYERLLALLDSDVTGEFISKFKICFKQFVLPERTWIYVTREDDTEEDEEDDA